MTIYKSSGKSGSTVASFAVNAPQTPIEVEMPSLEELAQQKKNPIEEAALAFNKLSGEEKNTFFAQMFNREIGEIIEAEVAQKVDAIEKKLLATHVESEQALQQELEQICELKLKELAEVINTFSSVKPEITLEQEDDIKGLICRIVTKLTCKTFDDASLLDCLLKEEFERFIQEDKPALYLSEKVLASIDECQLKEKLAAKYTVLASKELEGFAFKLALENGDILSSLRQRLTDFVHLTVELTEEEGA